MMKRMMQSNKVRTSVMMLCSAGLLTSAAIAQQDAPPPPPSGQQQVPPPGGPQRMGPNHRLERLKRKLNLNEEQTAQMKAIFAENKTRMDQLRENTILTPQDVRTQTRDVHREMQAKLRAVLTPDQQVILDKMQARERAARVQRGEAALNNDVAPAPAQPTSASAAPQR